SAAAMPDWVATAMTPMPATKQASRDCAQRRPRIDSRFMADEYHQSAKTMPHAAAGSKRLLVSTSPAENEAASTTGRRYCGAVSSVSSSHEAAEDTASLLAVGTIVWLSSELMFFSGLFAAYFTL